MVEIGGVRYKLNDEDRQKKYEDMFAKAERSEVRCPDKDIEKMMKSKIDEARKNRDTVGGSFEIIVDECSSWIRQPRSLGQKT